MTGKDLLKQIRLINFRIIGLQMEIERLETELTNTTVKPKEVDVQTSLSPDPMADKIIKKMEYEQKLITQYNEQIEIKTEALSLIDSMERQEDKSVLTLRYINCMSYKDIIDLMDVSRATISNKLRTAEKNFNELYRLKHK